MVAFQFTSPQHTHAGRKAAPNCRFDGSVAVNFVSASCRQCGNFGSAWNEPVEKVPVLTKERLKMIKHLQKIGNSRGIVLDKPILELLHIDDNASFEVTQEKNGLFLRPLSASEAYREISRKHRKSLDKLAK
jgi:antitoxin component of MazEF toxin-antitoxin module